MTSKSELMKLKKDQLADKVIELEAKVETLKNKGKPTPIKADADRKVKVSCTIKVTRINPTTGKNWEGICKNPVEMTITDARNTKGVVNCGQHS